MGTPAYMPPEQAEGRLNQMGPTADVYSLRATLYELLIGATPFDSRYAQVLLEDVQAGRFSPPCRVNPKFRRPLEAVCLKAMARKPGRTRRTIRHSRWRPTVEALAGGPCG